ncbi:putative salutaridinol 7-O-acetyltransferase [Rosa chinensis]|uniref:Putative salutaridinol 7-O-acetyltransferase n=1 Tax=Rosa chinensis TaxID=74649 RepID=A0A2P6RFP5_ROSCH|nr:acyltransferase Pun1 [Rosa chinensis]PRQ45237.1 putative salutaridinol 7-O-acetyltransferase [Rosa chinensis]
MGSPPTCTHSLVNITTRKIIRPVSPTPHHQRTLNLSLLDQLFPPTLYPTIIYFYSIDHFPSNNISESLQTSLSKALVYFYPLAGRLNGPASIDCNDEGAYFLEAQVNCQLSDLLKLPEHSLLNNLIPEFDPQTAHSALGSAVLLVQMSRFNCGGIALAVSLSHKIADATSCQTFLRAWADINRDNECDSQLMVPQFNGASLLPAKDSFVNNLGLPKYQSLATRRFVFDVTKIANLKVKIGGTNVQLVSAIILKSARAASYKSKPETCSSTAVLSQMVNLRRSMGSVVQENAMGNWFWPLQVVFKPNETELHELVANMRREITDFYKEKAGKFKGEDGFLVMSESFRERGELYRNTKGCISVYRATSLCKLPVYEIDFGWGQPTWVTSQSNQKNIFVLIDTKRGDGIEAWVTLDEEEMAIFETDEELLSFASLNPSASVNQHSRM